MNNKRAAIFGGLFLIVAVGLWWFNLESRAMAKTPPGEQVYWRSSGESFEKVIDGLADKGIIANPQEFVSYAQLTRKAFRPKVATYELKPGMSFSEVLGALQKPVSQMVRLPEGWWAARTAVRLEEKGVCSAQEYIALVKNPAEFQADVSFPLPADSLEGYLYPDTYDLPPMLGAKGVIRRQLKNFEEKVYSVVKTDDLHRALTVGSLIETEVAVDKERPIVAGVIENRLRQNMRLQLDATTLYAIQEWRQLKGGEAVTIDSPYNTYRVFGLPPGPICSPTTKSVLAALSPSANSYLYYVRGEGMTHLFGSTYSEHLQNIRKSNEFRRREAEGQ